MRSPILETKARRDAALSAGLAILALGTIFTLIILPFTESNVPSVVQCFLSAFFGFGFAVGVTLFLPLAKIADRILRKVQATQPTQELQNIVSELAVALNQPVGSIVIHHSATPNVAMLPGSLGNVVIATTGATEQLSRYELQAIIAAQFAGMEDDSCKVATRAEIVWWGTKIMLPMCMLLAFVFGRVGSSIGIMFVFFGMIMMPRWLEQVRDFCADVAAVRTTFDPTSLAQAMRKLAAASRSSHNLELGGRLLPVSPFLVMARREKLNTTMGWENSPRTWSSTDEVRLELLLRADRAEAMASGANPEEFTGKEYRKRWKQLGRSSETVKPE